jgi:hypothetical protein
MTATITLPAMIELAASRLGPLARVHGGMELDGGGIIDATTTLDESPAAIAVAEVIEAEFPGWTVGVAVGGPHYAAAMEAAAVEGTGPRPAVEVRVARDGIGRTYAIVHAAGGGGRVLHRTVAYHGGNRGETLARGDAALWCALNRHRRAAEAAGPQLMTPNPLTGWGQPLSAARTEGEALRAARKAKGLTQAEVARFAGCSASLVGRMERAQYPITRTFYQGVWCHLDLPRLDFC